MHIFREHHELLVWPGKMRMLDGVSQLLQKEPRSYHRVKGPPVPSLPALLACLRRPRLAFVQLIVFHCYCAIYSTN